MKITIEPDIGTCLDDAADDAVEVMDKLRWVRPDCRFLFRGVEVEIDEFLDGFGLAYRWRAASGRYNDAVSDRGQQ